MTEPLDDFEVQRRLERAKRRLRRLQDVLRFALEGLDVAEIARRTCVTRPTVYDDLCVLELVPRANQGKLRRPYRPLALALRQEAT